VTFLLRAGRPVVTVGGKSWEFDIKAFDDVRQYIEVTSGSQSVTLAGTGI
jgi:hypothetical protein